MTDDVAAAGRDRLVGRDAELAALDSALDGAIRRGRRVVLLAGEAGLGKTALVDAFVSSLATRHPRVDAVRGLCVPMGESGLPFSPVLGLLRSLERLHGTDRLVEWAGGGRRALGVLLPDLLQPAEPSEGLQLQMFEAVVRIVQHASAVRPLVLIVEDIHWADESSRAMLQFLARTVGDVPVLLVCSFRPDEDHRSRQLRPFLSDLVRLPGTTRVDLARLDRAEVAEMLSMLGEKRPSAERIDDLHRRSDGVPFYVEELAALEPERSDVPESLRGALEARTSLVDDDVLGTLGLMAVAGIRAHHELLAEAAVREARELEQHLRAAVDVGIIRVEGDEYAFRHALFGEAIYADLLPGERARLHARLAEALERRPDLSGGSSDHAIALHWSAAGDDERAFGAAIRATRSGSVAHAETLAMYERILELWDLVIDPETRAGSRADVLTAASRTARDAGEYDRAIDLVSAAIDLTGPQDVEARIERLLVRSQLTTDSLRTGARADVEEAEALLDAVEDSFFRVRMLGQMATFRLNAGADPVPRAEEAVAAARRLPDGESGDALADARTTYGTALLHAGEDDKGLSELREARSMPTRGLKIRLRNRLNLSDALHLTGRYDEAIAVAVEGVEEARAHGVERSFGTYLVGNAAESMLATGEWSTAAGLLAEAIALDPPSSHRTHLDLLLGWLHLWRDEVEIADGILRAHRSLVERDQPAPQFVVQLMRIDGEHAVLTGDPDRAWGHLLAFIEHRPLYDAARAWPLLAVGAAAAATLDARDPSGRCERLHELLDDMQPNTMSPVWRGVAEAELFDTGDGWADVVDLLRGTSCPVHLLPYAQLRLARHLSAARDRARLRDVIEEAATASRRLGARLLVNRLSVLAQRAGVARAQPDATPAPLAALTARELEVLRLVAEGSSNKDIGEQLYISTKTASVHVSNILAKLGASGRTEAAALAHRHGLLDAARR